MGDVDAVVPRLDGDVDALLLEAVPDPEGGAEVEALVEIGVRQVGGAVGVGDLAHPVDRHVGGPVVETAVDGDPRQGHGESGAADDRLPRMVASPTGSGGRRRRQQPQGLVRRVDLADGDSVGLHASHALEPPVVALGRAVGQGPGRVHGPPPRQARLVAAQAMEHRFPDLLRRARHLPDLHVVDQPRRAVLVAAGADPDGVVRGGDALAAEDPHPGRQLAVDVDRHAGPVPGGRHVGPLVVGDGEVGEVRLGAVLPVQVEAVVR